MLHAQQLELRVMNRVNSEDPRLSTGVVTQAPPLPAFTGNPGHVGRWGYIKEERHRRQGDVPSPLSGKETKR